MCVLVCVDLSRLQRNERVVRDLQRIPQILLVIFFASVAHVSQLPARRVKLLHAICELGRRRVRREFTEFAPSYS